MKSVMSDTLARDIRYAEHAARWEPPMPDPHGRVKVLPKQKCRLVLTQTVSRITGFPEMVNTKTDLGAFRHE